VWRRRDCSASPISRSYSIWLRPGRILHAKAVIADDEAAFVTSANLTEAAFDRNIEVGVLTRDHALAASLGRHFGTLIERGLLLPLPSP
jgi:phosphatidylserine/phosphatidylglycerophosphate/cardiolipin synthase-like enzyme